MSDEGLSPHEQAAIKQISRFFFVRKLIPETAAALALVLTGNKILKHEREVKETGGFECEGIMYVPAYEYSHDLGPVVDQIPDDSTVVFVEHRYVEGDVYTAPVSEIIDAFESPGQANLLKKSREKNIPIVFGDIARILWGKEDGRKVLMELYAGILKRNFLSLVEFMGSFYLRKINKYVPEKVKNVLQSKTSEVTQDIAASLLRIDGVIKGVQAVAGMKAVEFSPAYFHDRQAQASTRVFYRIAGLASHADVADAIVFQRNLVMAYKMKMLGENLKKSISKPKIAFDIGAGHAGIEDMIYLPISVLRELIAITLRWRFDKLTDKEKRGFIATRTIVPSGDTFIDQETTLDNELGRAMGMTEESLSKSF